MNPDSRRFVAAIEKLQKAAFDEETAGDSVSARKRARRGPPRMQPASEAEIQAFCSKADAVVPEAFLDLYRNGNGAAYVFQTYHWSPINGIAGRADEFDEDEFQPTWLPFLQDDFSVICIDAAGSAAEPGKPQVPVRCYDFKGSESWKVADRFEDWIRAAADVLESVAAEPDAKSRDRRLSEVMSEIDVLIAERGHLTE